MRGTLSRWVLLLLTASSSGCGFGAGSVTRIADGREFEARAISAEAYAAYARGALLEAAGDDRGALEAYQAALSEDGDSPEILARMGATQCRLAKSPSDATGKSATHSLRRATEVDPYSSSAWAEAARCKAHRGEAREALSAALRAAHTDPVSVTSAILVAELAEAAGDSNTARVWLDELVARAPTSREAFAVLARFGARHHDLGRELRARAGLSALGVSPQKDAALQLDRAVERGELPLARAAAIRSRLSPSELSLLLVERGQSAAAGEQARLVLGANPDDSDAWVARVVAADLRRDRADFENALRDAPASASGLSPVASRLYAELLERVVGAEARAAWLAAQPR
jgi:tetratricopeptide (TPR) repeat protein